MTSDEILPPTELPPSNREASAVPASIEVLLLDRDEAARDGSRYLLTKAGLVVTATDDPGVALRLAAEKHFGAALIDIDTPGTEDGVGFIDRVRQVSPATAVVLLAGRPTFELAAAGFRRGAADVMAKTPGQLEYLVARVRELCWQARRADERERLVRDMLAFHEQALRLLTDVYRRARRAEEAQRDGVGSPGEHEEFVVLVVDDQPGTAVGLEEALRADGGFRCTAAQTGGEALDLVGREAFHIALVKKELPDLSGAIVVRSLRRQVRDGLTLIFEPPAGAPGRLTLVEDSRNIELLRELSRGEQLVDKIRELRQAYIAKRRERRYLESFRSEHLDFIKQYVDLKQRFAGLGAESQK